MAFDTAFHTFTIKTTFINYNTGEELEYNECLSGLAIKKDFINNIFPLFVLNLYLTNEQRNYLSMNKFYISLKILRCINVENVNNNDVDSDDPLTDKLITNILLRPFDPDNILPLVVDDASVESQETNKQEQKTFYNLNCIPLQQLQINNTTINDCFAEANLNEIIINLISNVYNGDIYFQESINTTRYESLLIPPLNLIPALRYLQSNYRIYKNSLNIFFDNNKLYIYDIMDKTREHSNTFFINIKNDNIDISNDAFRNTLVDENDNIEKYYFKNLFFISNKDTFRYETGEDVVFSSYNENFDIVNRVLKTDDTENTGNDRKERYIWNSLGLQDIENAIKNKIYTTTTIQLSNIDYSLFKPDTLYNITGSPNSEFNGEYVLTEMEIFMSTSDSKLFKNSVNLGLLKI